VLPSFSPFSFLLLLLLLLLLLTVAPRDRHPCPQLR
jgi:hypothetical protein